MNLAYDPLSGWLCLSSSSLNVMHYNIRSLRSKYEEFSIQLQNISENSNSGQFDILCITETWLVEGEHIPLPGYIQRSDYVRLSGRGGGVSIFVAQRIPSTEYTISNAGTNGFEAAAVALGNDNMLVICVYRPPDNRLEDFLQQLEILLDECIGRFPHVIVAGDFNIDLSDSRSNGPNKLRYSMQSFGLQDVIKTPTRVTPQTCSIIDNFFINFDQAFCKAGNLDLGISDHYAQSMLIYPPINFMKNHDQKFLLKRDFSENRKKLFCNFLRQAKWDDVYSSSNVEEKFVIFQRLFQHGFNLAFPLKRRRVKSHTRSFKWQSRELKCLSNEKRDLELLLKTYNRIDLKNKLKVVNKCIKQKIKQLKSEYAQRTISGSGNKTKKIWDLAKNEIKKFDKPIICSIKANGEQVHSSLDIANEFNTFFTNPVVVGSRPSYCLSPVKYKNPINKISSLESFREFDETDVQAAVFSVKSKMSYGDDDIPSALFKEFFPSIRRVVTHLCQQSLSLGVFPSCLKVAKIIPIHKKGPRDFMGNYRPIALLPVLSKVLEKIVHRTLMSHFMNHKILSKSQFGFQSSKSAPDAVTDYVNAVYSELDKKEKTIGIFLDLQKAFDTVDHSILLAKLSSCGISGIVLRWLRSYLSNRTQYVEITGSSRLIQNIKYKSHTSTVKLGVPQGSVLGPLLFLVFINDLPECIKTRNTSLFADDSSFLVSAMDYRLLVERCQSLLNDLERWFQANGLMVNVTKSCLINFRLSNLSKLNDTPYAGKLRMFGESLPDSESTRFLGIMVDCRLDWIDHIAEVCRRVNKTQFIFRRLSQFLPKQVLIIVYRAYVESILKYGIILWGANSQIIKVFRAQKRTLRIITNSASRSSCRGEFKANNLLTVTSLFILELGIYAHKNVSEWMIGSNIHSYNTRNRGIVRLGKHRTASYESAPEYMGRRIYNNLPEYIKRIANHEVFKKTLKSWLCDREFYTVDDFFNEPSTS
jgi:exonuclease III